MAEPVTRWRNAIHYRHECEDPGCGRRTDCAVIKRRGKRSLRLCLDCFLDGRWKKFP